MYLSIDPGDKRTGYATFDEKGILTTKGILQGDEAFYQYMDATPTPDFLICEQFELRSDLAMQQSGSKMAASKKIGYLEGWCRGRDCELVMSRAQNLTMGAMYAGMKKPKGHCPDDLSAYFHGVYILQIRNIRKAQD